MVRTLQAEDLVSYMIHVPGYVGLAVLVWELCKRRSLLAI